MGIFSPLFLIFAKIARALVPRTLIMCVSCSVAPARVKTAAATRMPAPRKCDSHVWKRTVQYILVGDHIQFVPLTFPGGTQYPAKVAKVGIAQEPKWGLPRKS